MTSASWRRGRRHLGLGSVLLIAVGLFMAVPLAGGTGPLAPNAGLGTLASSPHPTPDKTCAVGNGPHFDAYDPVNHYIYVPNSGSSDLSIVSGGCTLVDTITFPTGAVTYAAEFDPTNNWVYVTDYALNQVYVLNGTKLLTTITSSAFDSPLGVTYDPGDAVMGWRIAGRIPLASFTERASTSPSSWGRDR